MPIGVLVNCLCVLAGGLTGAALKQHIPKRLKDSLPIVFGFVAITMGIMKIPSSGNITLVTFAVILGTVLGEALQVDRLLRRAALSIAGNRLKGSGARLEEKCGLLVMAMIAFCASGTGLFGAMEEGLSGDASILLSKAGLDFFTAVIFAAVVGSSIAFLSLPQAAILLTMFLCGGAFAPLLSETAKAAFASVGGVITLINGCAMAKISTIRPANTLPSLVLVLLLASLF